MERSFPFEGQMERLKIPLRHLTATKLSYARRRARYSAGRVRRWMTEIGAFDKRVVWPLICSNVVG